MFAQLQDKENFRMDPVCKSSQAQSLQQLLITAVKALVYVGTVTKVAIMLKNAN
jgi:hypothetical protein